MPSDGDPRDIEGMIRRLNSSVPVRRRTLIDYMENGGDTFETKEGPCSFDRSLIDYLDSVTTDAEKLRLRLPIFISTDVSVPGGAWKVEGETEVAVAATILGRPARNPERMRLSFADVADLKRRLPGLIFPIFTP